MPEIICKECGKPIPINSSKEKYVQCPHCGAIFEK